MGQKDESCSDMITALLWPTEADTSVRFLLVGRMVLLLWAIAYFCIFFVYFVCGQPFRDLITDHNLHLSCLQTLARQLAEVLLRGVCRSTYEPVCQVDKKVSVSSTPGHCKPAKYTGNE